MCFLSCRTAIAGRCVTISSLTISFLCAPRHRSDTFIVNWSPTFRPCLSACCPTSISLPPSVEHQLPKNYQNSTYNSTPNIHQLTSPVTLDSWPDYPWVQTRLRFVLDTSSVEMSDLINLLPHMEPLIWIRSIWTYIPYLKHMLKRYHKWIHEKFLFCNFLYLVHTHSPLLHMHIS